MKRVILDTNILFSALLGKSKKLRDVILTEKGATFAKSICCKGNPALLEENRYVPKEIKVHGKFPCDSDPRVFSCGQQARLRFSQVLVACPKVMK